MRIKNKKMLLAAAIFLLFSAAAGIIIFDRDSSIDIEKSIELAGKYLESSDYDNAIAIYNRLIAENVGCTGAYVGLAEAYYTKGNAEKALKVLENGLEHSSDEDILTEKIKTFFPDHDFEASDKIELYTETEITDTAEETAVPDT